MSRAQQEKPTFSKEELESTLGIPHSEATLWGGGQIENSRDGWAMNIMSDGNRAHHFKRDGFDKAKAVCGVEAPIRWLYGEGNYPRCKRCK